MSEIEWLPGKHQWHRHFDGQCLICGLRRTQESPQAAYGPPGPYLYEVEPHRWEIVPTPCVPRLREQVPGLFTAKEACKLVGVTHATFINMVSRAPKVVPAATLVRGNVYLWRPAQIARLKEARVSRFAGEEASANTRPWEWDLR